MEYFEYQRVGAGEFDRLEGDLALNSTRLHTIAFRPVAADGSYGETQMVEVYIDGEGPKISADVSYTGTAKNLDRKATVVLSAEDISGVELLEASVEGSEFARYTKPLVVSLLTEKVIRYRATDALGNQSKVKRLTIRGIQASR